MKLKPILCTRSSKNEFQFFLPDATDSHSGAWLSQDQYLIEWAKRHPVDSMPHCADPKCNRLFMPIVEGQLYCDRSCNNRHRARIYYREQNGITCDEKPIDRGDEPTQAYADVVSAIEVAKLEALARPPRPEIMRLPNGQAMTKSAADAIRYQRERDASLSQQELEIRKYMRFTKCLKLHGYELSEDFVYDSETLDELFALYKTQGETLTPEQIEPAVDQEARKTRLLRERAAAVANDRTPKGAGDPTL